MNSPRNQAELATAQDWQRFRHERDLADIKAVLSRPEGRRLIWWLLEITRFYLDEFTGNSRDYYDKGKKSIGSQIHARILAACGFKAFDKMYSEFTREHEREKQAKLAQMKEEE